MKILLVGDLHLDSQTPISRMDNYRQTTITKLEALLELAKTKKVSTILLSGDVFDRYDQPISYLNSIVTMFNKFKDAKIQVMSVIGNHDLPYNNMAYFSNTPLSLLFSTGVVKHLEHEKFDTYDIFGIDFGSKTRLSSLTVNSEKFNILVMHYATDNTVSGESIPRKELKHFDVVLSGHDHIYYPIKETEIPEGNTVIFRPGSFTRRTKDEQNLTRDIIVYVVDTVLREMEEVKLPGVSQALNVFKNQVFTENTFDLYKNDYNEVFNKEHFAAKRGNVFKIIKGLPPTVNSTSRKYMNTYLKGSGLKEEVSE